MTNVPQTETTVSVKELGHIVLYVRDLRQAIAFYRDVLGWRQVSADAPGVPFAAFSSGRTHHELLLIEVGPDAAPIPKGRRVGMYHFGLKFGDSDDDLRAVLRRVRDADVTVLGATDHTVTHSVYVLDPDGNELELYVDVPDVDWREHPELLTGPPKPLAL